MSEDRSHATIAALTQSTTALVGGWGIGTVIGKSAQGGDLFATDAPSETTDAQEFVTLLGLYAGLGVTWKVTENLVTQYGWKKLGYYSAAWVLLVAAGRAIRSRV